MHTRLSLLALLLGGCSPSISVADIDREGPGELDPRTPPPAPPPTDVPEPTDVPTVPPPVPTVPPPVPTVPPPVPTVPPPVPTVPPPVPTVPPPVPTVPPPVPTPPVGPPTQVCYPGVNGAWTTCLPIVAPTNPGTSYNYPSPLNGSPQYQAPVRYLDLQVVDLTTQLAPNFRLSEIAQLVKGRYAVVQPHAIVRLQALRNQLGAINVNSGFRPPGYNATIGGATYSRHMYGDAFDMSPQSASLSALQSACNSHGASYVGVYATHMHCDWRNDGLSASFYNGGTSSFAPTFSYDLPEHDAEIIDDDGLLSAPAIGWDEGEPLREWIAYDADGYAIETEEAEMYVPPEGAVSVEVWVGRRIVRTYDLFVPDSP